MANGIGAPERAAQAFISGRLAGVQQRGLQQRQSQQGQIFSQQQQQQQAALGQLGQRQELARAAFQDQGQEQQAIQELITIGEGDFAKEIQNQLNTQDEAQQTETQANVARTVEEAFQIREIQNPQEQTIAIQNRVQRLQSEGRDPSDTLRLLEAEPEERGRILDREINKGVKASQIIEARLGERGQVFKEGLARGRIGLQQVGAERLVATKQKGAKELEVLKSNLKRLDEQRQQELKTTEQEVKSAKTKFDQATKIRDQLQKQPQIQDFNKIESSFGRIQAAAEDPSAAGDLALIFNFMKMLDPGSVVRESEFATAANAAGVPDRIRAQFNRVLEGERLAPNTRKDFVGRADKIFNKQVKLTERIEKDFVKLAERFGLERDDIVVRGLSEVAEQDVTQISDDDLRASLGL